MSIGMIYLAVALLLLILSAVKDINKTKQVLKVSGNIALIQPAAVFPFAGLLYERGAGYGSLLGFVMTAILIGITTLPLEIKLFGIKFTLTRNILTFVLVFLMGIVFMLIL